MHHCDHKYLLSFDVMRILAPSKVALDTRKKLFFANTDVASSPIGRQPLLSKSQPSLINSSNLLIDLLAFQVERRLIAANRPAKASSVERVIRCRGQASGCEWRAP